MPVVTSMARLCTTTASEATHSEWSPACAWRVAPGRVHRAASSTGISIEPGAMRRRHDERPGREAEQPGLQSDPHAMAMRIEET